MKENLMSDVNEKHGAQEQIEQFIQKNRKFIAAFAGLIVIVIAGFIAGFAIRDSLRNKSFSAVEELSRRYEALRFDITSEEKKDEVDTLLSDVKEFAGKASGYAHAQAWNIAANIHADRQEWPDAQASWINAANAAAKTYLAPAAWYNAAVAAEEQNNIDEAIQFYNESLTLSDHFPAAARAQFSIGRLQEGRNEKTAALESYRSLVSKWPQDPVWTNLARSRIVVLEK
jgi:tetratricopeptide (TPR) repeat protein